VRGGERTEVNVFGSGVNLTGRIRLIRLTGELHAATVTIARRRIWPDVARSAEFIVDIEALSYLDSAGLGLLVAIHREVARRGGRWALVGASSQVVRLLEVTHADHFLPLFPSVADVEMAWHENRTACPESRDTRVGDPGEPLHEVERLTR
jgi:anti-anti-sigma factor